MRKMTFNFTASETADKLAALADIYNKTKTKVVCDLIEREFDSVIITAAINSATKDIDEKVIS
jgi:hypothetical protein